MSSHAGNDATPARRRRGTTLSSFWRAKHLLPHRLSWSSWYCRPLARDVVRRVAVARRVVDEECGWPLRAHAADPLHGLVGHGVGQVVGVVPRRRSRCDDLLVRRGRVRWLHHHRGAVEVVEAPAGRRMVQRLLLPPSGVRRHLPTMRRRSRCPGDPAAECSPWQGRGCAGKLFKVCDRAAARVAVARRSAGRRGRDTAPPRGPVVP